MLDVSSAPGKHMEIRFFSAISRDSAYATMAMINDLKQALDVQQYATVSLRVCVDCITVVFSVLAAVMFVHHRVGCSAFPCGPAPQFSIHGL